MTPRLTALTGAALALSISLISPTWADIVPAQVRQAVSQLEPKATWDSTGTIVHFASGEDYLIALPDDDFGTNTTATIKVVSRIPEDTHETADLIELSSGHFLVHMVTLANGRKTLPILDALPAKLRVARFPQETQLPSNFLIPTIWKSLTGNLLVPLDQLVGEDADKPNEQVYPMLLKGPYTSAGTTPLYLWMPGHNQSASEFSLPCQVAHMALTADAKNVVATCQDKPLLLSLNLTTQKQQQVALKAPGGVFVLDTLEQTAWISHPNWMFSIKPEIKKLQAPAILTFFNPNKEILEKELKDTPKEASAITLVHLSKLGLAVDPHAQANTPDTGTTMALPKSVTNVIAKANTPKALQTRQEVNTQINKFLPSPSTGGKTTTPDAKVSTPADKNIIQLQLPEPVSDLAWLASRNQLFTLSKTGKTMNIYSTPNHVLIKTIKLPTAMTSLALQNEKWLWLSNQATHQLVVFDTRWQEFSPLIELPAAPTNITADGQWLYALVPDLKQIQRINTQTLQADTPLQLDASLTPEQLQAAQLVVHPLYPQLLLVSPQQQTIALFNLASGQWAGNFKIKQLNATGFSEGTWVVPDSVKPDRRLKLKFQDGRQLKITGQNPLQGK
jgi:hypothetical protein